MNQLSLFNIDESGNTVLYREEKPSAIKGNLEDKYAEMLSLLDEYQKAVVEAPAESSMSCIAGAGCLAEDTVLRISRAKKSFKITIKELFLKFNRKKDQLWDNSISTKTRSFLNNEVIQLADIKAVTFSGVKRTYKLTLQNGYFINLTADHRILTKRGWVEAQFLQKNDEVMVDTLVKHKKTTSNNFIPKKRYKERCVGKYYVNAVIRKKRGSYIDFRAPEHRLVVEAEMNDLTLEAFIKATYTPNSLKLLTKETHVHHIDGDTKNNKLSNLQVLSIKEHLQYHTTGYKGFKHGFPEYSFFESLEEVGLKETYDIEMEGEPNFVANNIVVHNSGKTRTLISRAIKLSYIDKVDPLQIALITFTNKAANELKERYVDFFKDLYPEGVTFPTPHISTIHSFCLSQIRRTFGFNRTILSEYLSYKLFKDTCNTICMKETGSTPDIKAINAFFKVYQNMQSSLDILYLGIPLFDITGRFIGFQSRLSLKDETLLTLTDRMPYDRLLSLLTGNKKLPRVEEIVGSHFFPVNIRKELLPVILHTYMSEKYRNNTLDFSDMDFQYLMLMAQHKELREMVHNRYLHLMQDESQDSSPGQFLTCLFTDRESFEDFIKKPMP